VRLIVVLGLVHPLAGVSVEGVLNVVLDVDALEVGEVSPSHDQRTARKQRAKVMKLPQIGLIIAIGEKRTEITYYIRNVK
jgi:hypothetical protein